MDAAPDSVVRKRRRESLISPVLPDASQPPWVGECPATQVLRHGPSAGSALITEAIEVPRRSARASSEVQTRREGGRGLFVIHRGHCHALRVQPADLLRGVATRHVRASLLSVPASETTEAAYMPRPLAGCLPRCPAPQIEPGQDRLGQERDEGCGARWRPIGRS